MKRLNVPATRSNLIRLKDELDFASQGLELLEEKKEILVNQVNFLASKADMAREKLDEAIMKAYRRLDEALVERGSAAVEAAGIGTRAGENVHLGEKSLMGVVLPVVSVDLPEHRPQYGFRGTGRGMDETARAIHRAMENIAELAELEVGIKRLVGELRKTLKRINALEHIYVPLYRETVGKIRETLEEKEREALFQLKRAGSKARMKRTVF